MAKRLPEWKRTYNREKGRRDRRIARMIAGLKAEFDTMTGNKGAFAAAHVRRKTAGKPKPRVIDSLETRSGAVAGKRK